MILRAMCAPPVGTLNLKHQTAFFSVWIVERNHKYVSNLTEEHVQPVITYMLELEPYFTCFNSIAKPNTLFSLVLKIA